MGLLRDMLERRHQNSRDQLFREFDTYKTILSDNRAPEEGGFTDEQKSDAANRIITMTAPSKKHAEAMRPIIQGLIGARPMGEGETAGAGPAAVLMRGGQPPSGDVNAGGGGQPLKVGAGGQMDISTPSPSTLAGLPQINTRTDMEGDVMRYVPGSASTQALSATPSATPKQPQSQAPSRPTPTRTIGDAPPGKGIFAFPTHEQRHERMAAESKFQTELKGQQMVGLVPFQTEVANKQLEAQKARYDSLVASGMDPAYASMATGWKPPSGAFTAAKRPIPASAIGKNDQGQPGYVAGGRFNPIEGGFSPITKPAERHIGVEEQGRNDALAAKAIELKKLKADGTPDIDALTPQERIDAVARATGPLKQITDAKRVLADPNSTPDEKAAAETYLKGVGLGQQRTEVQIHHIQEGDRDPYANIPARNPNLQPDERDDNLLNSLPLGQRAKVEMLLNYDLQINPYVMARSKDWGAAAVVAHQVDPNWSAAQFPIRQSTMRAFATGREAQNIRALRTVIGHMGLLYDMTPALKNGDINFVNSIVNRIRRETGNPNVTNWQMAAKAVVDELANVFKTSGVTDQSVRQWEPTLTSSLANGQIGGALRTGLSLGSERLAALANQWHDVMGKTPFYFLTPGNLATLQKLGVSAEEMGIQPGDLPQAQTPGAGASGQAVGSRPQSFTAGGFSYVERTDIPEAVRRSIPDDGQLHTVKGPAGEFQAKQYQGKFYQVSKVNSGGGGSRGGR